MVKGKIKEFLSTARGSRKGYHLYSKNFGKCHFKKLLIGNLLVKNRGRNVEVLFQ